MRDDGRPRLDKDREIRIPWTLLRERGVTAGIVRVYGAIRSRAGFEPAADNFLLAWPRVQTIAKDAGVSRHTVSRATDLLEDLDYLIVWRRPNKTSTYGVIIQRDHFRRFAAKHGRAEAIADWKSRRSELEDESRAGQAEAASKKQIGRLARPSGRKPQARNMGNPVLQGSGNQVCRDAASDVAGMRHGSVLQLNCDPDKEIRGATDAALVSPSLTPELPKGNGNGQVRPPEPPRHRCTPEGNLRKRYQDSCADCKERLFRDRFYATALRKMGMAPPQEAVH